MIDWINEDPRFKTDETSKAILAKSPLTKAFLSPNRDSRIWLAEIQKTIPSVENQIDLNFASGANYALTIMAETLGLFNPRLNPMIKSAGVRLLLLMGKELGTKNAHKINPSIAAQLKEISFFKDNMNTRDLENAVNWIWACLVAGAHLPSKQTASPGESQSEEEIKRNNTDDDSNPFKDFINTLDI